MRKTTIISCASLCLMGLTACSHGLKVVRPEQNAIERQGNVEFVWENSCKMMGWKTYYLQISTSRNFSRDASVFTSDKPRRTINLTRTFELGKRSTLYWRVRADGAVFKSTWSKTYSFLYRKTLKRVEQPVVLQRRQETEAEPEPVKIDVPESLSYGAPFRISARRSYSLSEHGVGSLATHLFEWKIWKKSKVRFVERDNISKRNAEDTSLIPSPALYGFESDELSGIVSPETVVDWKAPKFYLILNYYQTVDEHKLFARTIDTETGMVTWQHFEGLMADLSVAEAFSQLLGPTSQALSRAFPKRTAIVLAGVFLDGRFDKELSSTTEQILLRRGDLVLLLRDLPVSKTLHATAVPGGETRQRTLYKLYKNQFVNISRGNSQDWASADAHIELEVGKIGRQPPQELLLNKGISEQQLKDFWAKPRTAMTATLISTDSGKILGKITVVAYKRTPRSQMAQWLVSRLVK